MLKIGYNIGIYFYRFMVFLAAIFRNKKAKLWIKGRKNWANNLSKIVKENKKPIVWIHTASLGEYEMAMPLIEKIDATKFQILVSFFSPSGYENIIQKNNSHFTVYLPLDTKKNAQKFIEIVKPIKVIFIKYDIWYFHLKEVLKHPIELYFITSVFTQKHWFIKYKAMFILNILKGVHKIFTIDQASAAVLENLEIINTIVAGDTRCDRVYDNTLVNFEDQKITNFIGTHSKVLVAGSTWKQDENTIKNSLYFLIKNGWKIIIAPHEIYPENIQKLCSEFKAVSYTNYQNENANVIILDKIGLLKYVYRYATIAYIGGAFKQGLHNILEPAAYGKPIIFGRKYDKYSEAKTLINEQAAFSLEDDNSLSSIIEKLSNEETFKKASSNSLKYILDNKGATDKIYSEVF